MYEDSVSELTIGAEPQIFGRRRGGFVATWARRFLRRPLGLASLFILVVFVFVAAFAPVIAPNNPKEVHLRDTLRPPGDSYILGSDEQGRDILSRIMYGARISLAVGVLASSFGALLGVVMGLSSGYVGGAVDFIVQRVVDSMMAIPGLVLAIGLVAVLGASLKSLIFVIGIAMAPGASRVVRGVTMAVRQTTYVEAARSVGAGDLRIVFRHILPNIFAPIIVLLSVAIGGAILVEASLSFLGLGVPPPTPTWGSMLSGAGRTFLQDAPWMALFPGLAITAVVWAVNMFGDVLRDELDPRLRKGNL